MTLAILRGERSPTEAEAFIEDGGGYPDGFAWWEGDLDDGGMGDDGMSSDGEIKLSRVTAHSRFSIIVGSHGCGREVYVATISRENGHHRVTAMLCHVMFAPVLYKLAVI